MAYVSARYAPLPKLIPEPEGTPRSVLVIDQDGQEWCLRENSEVGDWLEFKAKGGQIEPSLEDVE